jgi:hypothetical protein
MTKEEKEKLTTNRPEKLKISQIIPTNKNETKENNIKPNLTSHKIVNV